MTEKDNKKLIEFFYNMEQLVEFTLELRKGRTSVENNIHSLERLITNMGCEAYKPVLQIKQDNMQYLLLRNEHNDTPMILKISGSQVLISQLSIP